MSNLGRLDGMGSGAGRRSASAAARVFKEEPVWVGVMCPSKVTRC